jgi:AcrR family transcriptional regulator/Ni2+-binding GTPase involved in maturation of urease and hydrogenase
MSSGRPRATSRSTIAEAATELFLERGFAETTIADITQRAGVSRSSFFNYFSSKSDVLWAALDDGIRARSRRARRRSAERALRAAAVDIEADSLALAIIHGSVMGLSDDLADERAIRTGILSRAVSDSLVSTGMARLEADVHAAALSAAVFAAIWAWAASDAPRPPSADWSTARSGRRRVTMTHDGDQRPRRRAGEGIPVESGHHGDFRHPQRPADRDLPQPPHEGQAHARRCRRDRPRDPARPAGRRRRAGRRQGLHGEGARARPRRRGQPGAQPCAAGRADRQRRARRDPRRQQRRLQFAKNPPTVIMLAGLQGSGKTTFAGKLARQLEKDGHTPLLVAADLQRPNAVNQLQVVAERPAPRSTRPSRATASATRCVARDGVETARRQQHDVVIIDTAGRLGVDAELMKQAADIRTATDPDEVLFVIDAMIGQDAVNTAKAFQDGVDFTGVVLSKLDGDARGGAALSVASVTGRPIIFASTGENLDDLEAFHPDRMASRILDLGDILTLIEQAQQAFDEEEARKVAEKLATEQFTLEDFLDQLQQMKKMGSMKKMLGMLPAWAR